MRSKNILTLVMVSTFLLAIQLGNAQSIFSDVDHVLDEKQRILGGNVCALILKNSKVVYTYQLGHYDENTQEPIASCSKWLTAALVMTFVDEGKLSVDEPVSKYLPGFSEGGKEKILIRHCLSHTTGIQSERITIASLRKRKQYATLGDEVNNFSAKPMVGEPGTVFAYSNIGINIAGRILEVISGKDFETLFQERIAHPLGMTRTTFIGKQAVNPSGSAKSTASDYLKFLEMMLHQGNFHGKQILSERSVRAMQISQTAMAKVLYVPQQGEGIEYAFGEWLLMKDEKNRGIIVGSPGLFGTYPCINWAQNYASIIFVKNLRIKGRKETYHAIQNVIDEAMVKLSNSNH
jgi:CubicO group peptidase (beta-lactamase class C family)